MLDLILFGKLAEQISEQEKAKKDKPHKSAPQQKSTNVPTTTRWSSFTNGGLTGNQKSTGNTFGGSGKSKSAFGGTGKSKRADNPFDHTDRTKSAVNPFDVSGKSEKRSTDFYTDHIERKTRSNPFDNNGKSKSMVGTFGSSDNPFDHTGRTKSIGGTGGGSDNPFDHTDRTKNAVGTGGGSDNPFDHTGRTKSTSGTSGGSDNPFDHTGKTKSIGGTGGGSDNPFDHTDRTKSAVGTGGSTGGTFGSAKNKTDGAVDDAKLFELTAPGNLTFKPPHITEMPFGGENVPVFEARDKDGNVYSLTLDEVRRGTDMRAKVKEGLRKQHVYYIDPLTGSVKIAEGKEQEDAVKDHRILWDGYDGAGVDVKSVNIPSDWANNDKYKKFVTMGEAYYDNALKYTPFKRGARTDVKRYYAKNGRHAIGYASGAMLNLLPDDVATLDYMTENEVVKYDYLLGRFGPQAGRKYLKTLEDDIRDRAAVELIKRYSRESGKNTPIMSVLSKPVFALESAVQGGYNFMQDITGNDDKTDAATATAGLIMSGLDEGRNKVVPSGAGKVFLNVLNGFEENWPEIAASMIPYIGKFLSPVVGASQNMGNKYASYVENGIVGEKGTTLNAVISGAAGAASWSFMGKGTGKLVGKLLPGAEGTVKSFVRSTLSQSLTGAGIGATQYAVDRLADRLFLGENSDFNRLTKSYIAQGMTEDDARDKAWDDTLQGGVSAAVVGSLTSTIMGLPKDAQNALSLAPRGRRITERADFDMDEFLRSADKFGKDSESYKNAQRLKSQTGRITDSQIGAQDLLLSIDEYRTAVYMSAMDRLTGTRTETEINADIPDMRYSVNTNADEHTPEQRRVIAEYEAAVDNDVLEFAKYAREHKNDNRTSITLSDVSDSAARDIKRLTGIDVDGYEHNMRANTIRHIDERHGVAGNADHSMSDDRDISRISYVLENYDNVELLKDTSKEFRDKNQKPSPVIRYSKRIDGTYYAVEAVPDTKAHKLQIVSAYKNKAAEQQALIMRYDSPQLHAQDVVTDAASVDRIPQTEQEVKRFSIKKDNPDQRAGEQDRIVPVSMRFAHRDYINGINGESFDNAVNRRMKNYPGLSRRMAESEAAADLALSFVQSDDPRNIISLARNNRELVNKVYSAVRDLRMRVQAFGGKTLRDPINNERYTYKDLVIAEKLYKSALSAAENDTGAENTR